MRKIFLSKDVKQLLIKLSLACLLIIFASCFMLEANTKNTEKKDKYYFLVTSILSYFHGITDFHCKDLINWQQIGIKQNRKSLLNLLGQQSNGGILLLNANNFPHNQTYHTIITNSKDLFSSWSMPIWLNEAVEIDSSFIFNQDINAKLLI